MLILTKSIRTIDFSQLMSVYEEANRVNGALVYPQYGTAEQLLMAEQDFYAYLNTILSDGETYLAIWAPEGRYKAALRLEPYLDGMLLTALETAHTERRKGYAEALLRSVISTTECSKIYSHVDKDNIPSICVHEKCGFLCLKDYAVYLDGSVSTKANTYLFEHK